MKINFKIILFCFLTNNIIGQIKDNPDISFPPQNYESKLLDKTKQNIYYNYIYTPTPKEKFKTTLTVLQIGESYSKFSDVFLLKKDSLDKQFSHLKNLGVKELNLSMSIMSKDVFKKSIIKNLSIDSITIQGKVFSTKYEYEEKTSILKWKLINDAKSILDYKVKKATVNYGGRNWIAWYSEEIPINLGPYVFGNLPGLILELYDDNENFHFTAIGLDNKVREIYKRIEREIIKTSKENFFKAERNFHEKPELFIRASMKGGANFKTIPYSPIEFIE